MSAWRGKQPKCPRISTNVVFPLLVLDLMEGKSHSTPSRRKSVRPTRRVGRNQAFCRVHLGGLAT